MSGAFQHIIEAVVQSGILAKTLPDSHISEHAKACGVLAALKRSRRNPAADVDALWAKCESPIETALAAALCYAPWPCKVRIIPQFKIGAYRLDFLIYGRGQRINVECDGKEYHHHDITMAQWQADRARDRFMESEGISVIRFSGTQIWTDAVGCAVEVAALLKNLIAGDRKGGA